MALKDELGKAKNKANQMQAEKESFNVKSFFSGVVAEMRRVSWISKKELVTDTGVVAIAIVIVCSLIWVCDTVFARLFQIILQ